MFIQPFLYYICICHMLTSNCSQTKVALVLEPSGNGGNAEVLRKGSLGTRTQSVQMRYWAPLGVDIY
jgi:hypothetical protein